MATPRSQNMSAPVDSSPTSSGQPDMGAILTRLQELEERNKALSAQVDAKEAKLTTLTASKSKEMHALLENIVSQWLTSLNTTDESVKDKFKEGLKRMADRGENNPIFDVLCCASEQSVTRATELEKLRLEHEDLKKRTLNSHGHGEFASHDSRMTGGKRGAESMDTDEEPMHKDIWDEFEHTMLQNNGLRQ